MKKPAIYVVTYHDFNHRSRDVPFDRRFLETDNNFIFYLIDPEVPDLLKNKRCILEREIDSTLPYPGRLYLAEWTLLLAEYKHRFCEYPFFMTSSRFFEKNTSLRTDLNLEWERLFSFFDNYRWGYLPSYDRMPAVVDANSPLIPWNTYFTPSGLNLLSELYGPYFNNRVETPYTGDFWCNYIGFRDRSALEEYVNYYLPIINRFFTPDWMLKEDLSKYLVMDIASYRNFKPFTLLLEAGSHQFFFDTRNPYFALNYDGYYEVHENAQSFARIGCLTSADPKQKKRLGNRAVQVTSFPQRHRDLAPTSSSEPRPASKLVPDPILSFKIRELFDTSPLHLDLDSGRGLPMLKYSLDCAQSLCVDGSEFTEQSVVTDIWATFSRQALNGDAFGHIRVTDEVTGEPVLFDVVTAFTIPTLPRHLYGNFVRNILAHLSPQGLLLLGFTPESREHADFTLASLARSGVTGSPWLDEYLGGSTWLHDGFMNGTIKALSNSHHAFEARIAQRREDRDFLLRYRSSVTSTVDIMRDLIQIKPHPIWTGYLLHLKDVWEDLSSKIIAIHP